MLHLNSDDYLWVDNDDIDHIIEEINQINPEIKLDLEEFNEKFPTIWKSVISHLEEKVQANFQDLHKTETMDTIKTFMPEALSSITKISHIYVSMFLLSLITSGHNQLTRYPCACCGELPENNYNKDTPIVERFNDLYILLDRAINYYDDVFLLSNGIFEDDTKLILS